MVPKQREMDGVVKQIFTAIETQPHLQSTLFVVCGDHGMNDAGNHGASSPGETSPALVFMSPKLKVIQKGLPAPVQSAADFQYYTTVEQSDLAPTLAALLGFPVPKNNLGALIPEFLPFWSSSRGFHRYVFFFLDIMLMRNRKGPISAIDAEWSSNPGRHHRRLRHSDSGC
jgi:ethanolamine phosphate transferase 2 subunit G